jgi:hypothetical protein
LAGGRELPDRRDYQPGFWGGSITGTPTCGAADDVALCLNRYHDPGCDGAPGPEITEALQPVMRAVAAQPLLDARGQAWETTLSGWLEAATGARQLAVSGERGPLNWSDHAQQNAWLFTRDRS